MSLNKCALIRYYALDRCFSNTGRKYFIDDLLEVLRDALMEEGLPEGIKRRQLFDDFNFMRINWHAPIEGYQDGKKFYYRYEDPEFSINNQPLNETEINKLKDAIAIIGRFKGMPQFEWVDEILTKINYGLGVKGSPREIISFDNNEYLKGIDFLGILFDAIVYKKVLKIKYQPYKSNEAFLAIFHPYFLKQYNNRWFVLGLNQEYKVIHNYALDRIQKITEIKGKYNEDIMPDFDEYFEDIFGVTKPVDMPIEKIEIRVTNERAPYIKSKPIHGSQKKIKEDETGYYFTIEIIPNNEFYQQVFSFGPDMEIISPTQIRNLVKNKLKEGLKNYK